MTLTRLDVLYALVAEHNPLCSDDPDDIAEAWNGARDAMDIRTDGALSARQLDLYADRAVKMWRATAEGKR